MDQYLPEEDSPQVLYQGRWVSRDTFRAFVYNAESKKLANSYKEFSDLISSGLWFASRNEIKPNEPINIKSARGRKPKHGSSNS